MAAGPTWGGDVILVSASDVPAHDHASEDAPKVEIIENMTAMTAACAQIGASARPQESPPSLELVPIHCCRASQHRH